MAQKRNILTIAEKHLQTLTNRRVAIITRHDELKADALHKIDGDIAFAQADIAAITSRQVPNES